MKQEGNALIYLSAEAQSGRLKGSIGLDSNEMKDVTNARRVKSKVREAEKRFKG